VEGGRAQEDEDEAAGGRAVIVRATGGRAVEGERTQKDECRRMMTSGITGSRVWTSERGYDDVRENDDEWDTDDEQEERRTKDGGKGGRAMEGRMALPPSSEEQCRDLELKMAVEGNLKFFLDDEDDEDDFDDIYDAAPSSSKDFIREEAEAAQKAEAAPVAEERPASEITAAPAASIVSPFDANVGANTAVTDMDQFDLDFTEANVDKVLDEVRPYLILGGWNVSVHRINMEAKDMYLVLEGACGSFIKHHHHQGGHRAGAKGENFGSGRSAAGGRGGGDTGAQRQDCGGGAGENEAGHHCHRWGGETGGGDGARFRQAGIQGEYQNKVWGGAGGQGHSDGQARRICRCLITQTYFNTLNQGKIDQSIFLPTINEDGCSA